VESFQGSKAAFLHLARALLNRKVNMALVASVMGEEDPENTKSQC
jgi:hypothetical protein